MDIVNKHIVLKLNSFWQPVGTSTVANAFVDLVAGICCKALDIQYCIDGNGGPDFNNIEYMNPTTWEEWIKLPIYSWHEVIHTPKMTIRVPTIIIAHNCKEMPKKKFRKVPSKDGVWIRDSGIDQYTGEKIKKEEASIDHVIPRSRGGDNSWENVALTKKDRNHFKKNRLNHEIGYNLIKKPTRPNDMPLYMTIREARHRDWNHFLIVKDK